MSSERTPIQSAAKRLYDALTQAERCAADLAQLTRCSQPQVEVERVFDSFSAWMHPEDAE